MKNTAGDAKQRGRKVPKSVQQQYKWIKKQKKETEVSLRLANFVLQCTNNLSQNKGTQFTWELKEETQ